MQKIFKLFSLGSVFIFHLEQLKKRDKTRQLLYPSRGNYSHVLTERCSHFPFKNRPLRAASAYVARLLFLISSDMEIHYDESLSHLQS